MMLRRIIEWLRRLLARLKGRNDVVDPTGRTADGEFSPPEPERREYPPERGFGQAIQNALDNMSKKGWEPGPYERVSLKLTADVTVTNPGQIDTYRARISHP
jgi:hypothetical protein